jgi:hypothetical protein
MESAVALLMTGHPEAAGAPLAATDAAVAKLNGADNLKQESATIDTDYDRIAERYKIQRIDSFPPRLRPARTTG